MLLFMCLFSVFAVEIYEAQESSQASRFSLNDTNSILVPHLSIGVNWTYPYDQMPVISENQSLNGSIFAGANASAAEICVSGFSIGELLSAPQAISSQENCSGPSITLNLTEQADFVLPKMAPGLYTISAFDGINSTALQLLVTSENLSLQLPANILAGEPLKVKANIARLNQSRIFGAVMISREDYENMSLNISSSNAGLDYNATLKLADIEQQLPGLTRLSTDLAMNLMSLLPANSAAGMQESSEAEVEFYLLTDGTWPKGDYILTCAVYSRNGGLLDLKQETIVVT